MKKIYSYALPALGLIISGTNITSAQSEKQAISAEYETTVSPAHEIALPPVQTSMQSKAASVLFDNGPLVNFPGQGTGGADISSLANGLLSYGYSCSRSGKTRLSDDFTIPAGETWTIDSVAFYNYQTGASSATSTFTIFNMVVRSSSPLVDPTAASVVWGDTAVNILEDSYWSGIYRTSSTTFTVTTRPIMKNIVNTYSSLLKLPAGTYWLDWQAAGSLTSGPWNPPITLATATTGNGLQLFNSSWAAIVDTIAAGPSDDAPQGFPFTLYGSINSGVNEIYSNNDVSIFPNPMHSTATVSVSDNIRKTSSGFSFAMYDAIGNLISRTNGITSNKFTVTKENIPSGVYMYEVLNGNEIIKRGKLSVQ